MSERFFKVCPVCNRFFYDREVFKKHGCGEGIAESEPDAFPESDDGAEEAEDEPKAEVIAERRRDRDVTRKTGERAMMLQYLKRRGIDMRGERSLRKIREAYENALGKEK